MKTTEKPLSQGDKVKCENQWTGTIEQLFPSDDFINEPTASVRADDNGSSYIIPISKIQLI